MDRPGVKPLCCGRCFAKIVLFIRARQMWANILAGTDRSDMPRYLVQSDVEPFPFQSGRIMARFQSVGITQYFQMSVKRGSSQLMTGAPPDLSSSAVIPQIPGARFFFSFRIAADIWGVTQYHIYVPKATPAPKTTCLLGLLRFG